MKQVAGQYGKNEHKGVQGNLVGKKKVSAAHITQGMTPAARAHARDNIRVHGGDSAHRRIYALKKSLLVKLLNKKAAILARKAAAASGKTD
jgi:hypothetical protein